MERLLVLVMFAFMAVAPVWAEEASSQWLGEFPKVGPYQVLRGDFHMHTVNSDGGLTTRQRIEECHKLGYEAIAVTDHYTMRACRLAKSLGEPLGLVVLRGIETGIAQNEHINVVGMDADYKPRDPHNWSETPDGKTVFYQDELRALAQHGGFVMYNHPHVGYREPVKWGVAQGLIQGIEVKNEVVGAGWNTVSFNGSMCYPSAFDFALEHNLTLFANTDVHVNRLANPPVTLVFVTERSEKGVMEALRAGRTVAWFDGMLWGKPELARQLVEAMVSVKWSTTPEGASKLTLSNQSPCTLKAEMDSPSKVTMELPKGGSYDIDLGKAPRNVELRWTNVWVNAKENLVTQLEAPKTKGN